MLDQVVKVVKSDGQVKVKGAETYRHRRFLEVLMGLIFLLPAGGFAVGAASGAMAGHFTKYGIAKEYLEEIDSAIQPGQSAPFILAENVKIDRVVSMLIQYHPKVLRTSLTSDQEEKLKEGFGTGTGMPMPAVTS